MSTIQLTLSDELKQRLDSRVSGSDFADAAEYVIALLRCDLDPAPAGHEKLLRDRLAQPRDEMTPEFFQQIRKRVAQRRSEH
jgi:Arc/MetJ-type ribon-helix-helix transcriptional regulator